MMTINLYQNKCIKKNDLQKVSILSVHSVQTNGLLLLCAICIPLSMNEKIFRITKLFCINIDYHPVIEE